MRGEERLKIILGEQELDQFMCGIMCGITENEYAWKND